MEITLAKSKSFSTQPNIFFVILFGALSIVLSLVRLKIPGLGNGLTSLNEAPLLIAIFYITNPLYLLLLAPIASLSSLSTGGYFVSLLMHLIGMLPFWYYYHRMVRTEGNSTLVSSSLLIALGIVIYYLLFLLPLMTYSDSIININGQNFADFYFDLLSASGFEIISTVFIVTLFAAQKDVRQKLNDYLLSLEERITERTAELDKTVQRLHEANQELQMMNESLDHMVEERTHELHYRNIQLTGYAFINSHLLRAPIARILGLSNLIKYELESAKDQELVEKLIFSCEELDQIVRLLSDFLSEESPLSELQLESLQKRITAIAMEVKEIM